MTLLKCETCGGSLEIDAANDAAICQFCGSTYSRDTVQKMIVEYRGKVQIEGQSFEELLERGNVFLSLREWDAAAGVFADIANLYPNRYEGWWGIVRAGAKGSMDNIIRLIPREDAYTKYYNAALQFAVGEAAEEIETAYAPVLAAREEYLRQMATKKKRNAISKVVGTVLSLAATAGYVYLMFSYITDSYLDFAFNFSGSAGETFKAFYLATFLPASIYAGIMAILFFVLFRGDSFRFFRKLSTVLILFSAIVLVYAEHVFQGGGTGKFTLLLMVVVQGLFCAVSVLPGFLLSLILSKFD